MRMLFTEETVKELTGANGIAIYKVKI